jgi:uncharacterized protein involved in type VI secretion and phage assembly
MYLVLFPLFFLDLLLPTQAILRSLRYSASSAAESLPSLRRFSSSTRAAANAFAQSDYILRHNNMFAEDAVQQGNAHRPVAGLDLHRLLPQILYFLILGKSLTISIALKILD